MKTNKYNRNKGIAWREIEGCVYLVDPASSTLSELSESGGSIWKLLDEPKSIDEIARALISEFDVALTDAVKDSESFLEDLEAKKLVTKK